MCCALVWGRTEWGSLQAGIRESSGRFFDKEVELGGIEPPSVEWLPAAIRPFPVPVLRLLAAGSGVFSEASLRALPWLDDRRVFPRVSGLSCRQRSFPAVFLCFCCQAAVDRPRVPPVGSRSFLATLTSWSGCERQGFTFAVSLMPRLRSLSNSGRVVRLLVSTSKPVSPLSMCVPTTAFRRGFGVGRCRLASV